MMVLVCLFVCVYPWDLGSLGVKRLHLTEPAFVILVPEGWVKVQRVRPSIFGHLRLFLSPILDPFPT